MYQKLKRIFSTHLPILVKTTILKRCPRIYVKRPFSIRSAILNITDNCNMACIMCNEWKENKKDALNTNDWCNVLSQLKRMGVRDVTFAGGEPLLRKDLADMLCYAADLKIRTHLITSGYLLNQEKMDHFIDAGLKSISISIDGVNQKYELIRGRKFQRVEQACQLISAYKAKKRIDASVGFVLMKPTLDSVDEVLEFCTLLNLPLYIQLLDHTPYLFQIAENKNIHWIQTEEDVYKLNSLQKKLMLEKKERGSIVGNRHIDISYFSDYFKDPIQKKIPCTVSQLRVLIDSWGNVYGGCWSMGSYGNLLKDSLDSILSSTAYLKNHRKMFYKNCPGCSCGYMTNLRYNLSSQVKSNLLRVIN